VCLLHINRFAASSNACAQNAKEEIAVALIQHYAELADSSYREMNKQEFKGGGNTVLYNLPNIGGAGKTELTASVDVQQYTLTFYRINRLAVNTCTQSMVPTFNFISSKVALCRQIT
jgi:hypothetical protein